VAVDLPCRDPDGAPYGISVALHCRAQGGPLICESWVCHLLRRTQGVALLIWIEVSRVWSIRVSIATVVRITAE
jgi:hypothetical protein